jgi:hypothetical protein
MELQYNILKAASIALDIYNKPESKSQKYNILKGLISYKLSEQRVRIMKLQRYTSLKMKIMSEPESACCTLISDDFCKELLELK